MSVPRQALALLKGLRPKQWIKNLLVFAGFVLTFRARPSPGMV